MSIIRAGDAVVMDSTKRDRRLRAWCLRSARTAEKWAQKARERGDWKEAQVWVDLHTQFMTAAESLKEE